MPEQHGASRRRAILAPPLDCNGQSTSCSSVILSADWIFWDIGLGKWKAWIILTWHTSWWVSTNEVFLQQHKTNANIRTHKNHREHVWKQKHGHAVENWMYFVLLFAGLWFWIWWPDVVRPKITDRHTWSPRNAVCNLWIYACHFSLLVVLLHTGPHGVNDQ